MFLAISGALCLIAIIWLCWPLLQGKMVSRPDTQSANVGLLQNQLTELEGDLQQGVISREQYEAARIDLERSFLENAEDQDAGIHTGNSPRTALVLALLIPAIAYFIYYQVGTDPDEIRYVAEQRQTEGANPHASGTDNIDVAAMVERVRQRALADPNDLDSWRMLARSMRIMGDMEGAAQAYRHLIDQGVAEVEIYSNYADLIATLDGGIHLDSEAYQWTLKALELEPTHAQSLWIAGTAAYYSENHALAKEYWERLLGVVEPGSQTYQVIQRNLEQVEQALAQQQQ